MNLSAKINTHYSNLIGLLINGILVIHVFREMILPKNLFFADCLEQIPQFSSLVFCKFCKDFILADSADLMEHETSEEHRDFCKIFRNRSVSPNVGFY